MVKANFQKSNNCRSKLKKQQSTGENDDGDDNIKQILVACQHHTADGNSRSSGSSINKAVVTTISN